jgi:GNAT superfamily N-acetyltransferase
MDKKRLPVVRTEVLTPQHWPDLEALFGKTGACGGCWCMYWRLERGQSWDRLKGAPARRRLRALVESRAAHGILAYVDDRPVGWASVERRRDLPRLDRAPSLACSDVDRVWSVPCFFIDRQRRGQGVATALLAAAVDHLEQQDAEIVEGYPVRPQGGKVPAAFAWTGVPALFEAAGFTAVDPRPKGKQRHRRWLSHP